GAGRRRAVPRSKKGYESEGAAERQEGVRPVQDHPAPRSRARDLLEQPAAQAAARVGGSNVARIAGVDLPREKRIDVALRYIYGIGPTRASKVVEATRITPGTKVRDLSEEEVVRIREFLD